VFSVWFPDGIYGSLISQQNAPYMPRQKTSSIINIVMRKNILF
jgi:hypothetical protein